MKTHPLISRHGLDDVLAWRPEGPVSVRRFLSHAQALVAHLPESSYLLNMCEDRYLFAVGFAAGLLSGKISLQPSSQSPETLKTIALDYPSVICLTEQPEDFSHLLCMEFPSLSALDGEVVETIPSLPIDQVAAILFTSGSTGMPQPHQRTFGKLVQSAVSEAQGLELHERGQTIVGTVPAQHSFGFESTFLLSLYGGCSFWSGKPFYAQDIVDVLEALPVPRMLVTTPFHLAALVGSGLNVPKVDLVLSATAPLSTTLADQAETFIGAPVKEIYGSTESSALACRRATEGAAWTLLPGVMLRQVDEVTYADEGHVPSCIALSDVIELCGNRQFFLHGRNSDLINIAGKRTSLSYLNHQICEITGVDDAVFFLPDEVEDRVSRLAVFVVAPNLKAGELTIALRQRIDTVFMPRRLFFVDALPRNHLAKLPRDLLKAMYLERVSRG